MFDTLEAPAERLVDVVDALLAAPSVDLAPAAALDRLGMVLAQGERLTVVALDGVADLEHRELFALDGAGSATGWLRARRVGGDPRLRAFARHLSDRPVVRDALVAGRLGTDAALKVCTALGSVPFDASESDLIAVLTDGARNILIDCTAGGASPADLTQLDQLSATAVADLAGAPSSRLEPVFVFLAERIATPALARSLRDLVEALVPALLEESSEEMYDDETLDLQQVLDGRWHVTGYLTPETGAALDAELTRRVATIPQDPEHLQSIGKRRAVALGQLARDGAATDGAGSARPAADLTIIIREETLTQQGGALPARLADGTRLPASAAQRLGCDGRLSAVIVDALGHALHASGTHRHATQRERRALHAQWGGCAIDGCTEPFSHTRPHHVIPWWLSKITRLKDLAPLCEHHHHDIHEGKRTLRLRDGRHIGPLGWVDLP